MSRHSIAAPAHDANGEGSELIWVIFYNLNISDLFLTNCINIISLIQFVKNKSEMFKL